MILIIILHALWAASVTSSKVILQYTSKIFLVGSRMTLSGALLLAYQYFNPRTQFSIEKSHLKYYAQIIIFGIYLNYILRFWAFEQSITATKAMFLFNLSPFFSALYSYFFFSEKLSISKWIGLGLGFSGLIPVLLTTSTSEQAMGEFYFISLQEFVLIIAVAMHSYSWILMQKLIRKKGTSAPMINGICMLAGGVLALVTSWFIEGTTPVSNVPNFLALLTFIIIISNVICHNLCSYLLSTHSATFVSLGGFLGPPFAALYGKILFNEVITWHYYASGIIVFFALLMYYKDDLMAIPTENK